MAACPCVLGVAFLGRGEKARGIVLSLTVSYIAAKRRTLHDGAGNLVLWCWRSQLNSNGVTSNVTGIYGIFPVHVLLSYEPISQKLHNSYSDLALVDVDFACLSIFTDRISMGGYAIASICPFVPTLSNHWPWTCVQVGHDHSSQGIEGQGRGSG